MDGVKPLERLLRRVYGGDSASGEAVVASRLAENLTPQEFLERLSARAFKSLLEGKHHRMRPGVEWLARKVGARDPTSTPSEGDPPGSASTAG